MERTDSGDSFHSASNQGPALFAEPSFAPDVDEDGVLRRDYVLVEETTAVEFHRVADG